MSVKINNTLSGEVVIENKVRQTGALSIILCFLLAINDIANKIPQPVQCQRFLTI